MSPPLLVALVYRAGCLVCARGCCRHAKGGGRQYAFYSLARLLGKLAAWLAA
jgi:hypothetical protein